MQCTTTLTGHHWGMCVCVDCQSILHMFIHTEVDACTLNCRHNVSNFSVVETKMKRPLVSEGRFFPVYIYGMQVGHCGHV